MAGEATKYEQFVKYMISLGEIFSKEITGTLLQFYWMVLKDFCEEEIKSAFNRATLTLKFFPKPAELLEIIQGNQNDKAMIAWEKVFNAIGRIGPYQSVVFDDPVIHSTIELMGGWIELGNITTDEIKWKQKEFEKIYLVMVRKKKHPEHLAGIGEKENFKKGLHQYIPDPIFIGERKQLPKPTLELMEVS
jgi:hypothetical protein